MTPEFERQAGYPSFRASAQKVRDLVALYPSLGDWVAAIRVSDLGGSEIEVHGEDYLVHADPDTIAAAEIGERASAKD